MMYEGDNDEEDLSDSDFDDLEVINTPDPSAAQFKHRVGTSFLKDFPGSHGRFTGEVKRYEGHRYHVKYDDGDSEDLSEWELENLEIVPES